MPCLVGCLALVAPRVVIVLVWLLSDYLHRAYETVIWPVLGFLCMPVTTLAYAWAMNSGPPDAVEKFEIVVIVIAVLIDLGIVGGNARSEKVRWSHVEVRAGR